MKRVKNLLNWVKKHKILSLIGIIVIAVLIFVFRPKAPPPIETSIAKKTNLVQSLSVTGSIFAKKSVNLSPLSSGLLAYIGPGVGDKVTAGQIIAALDQRTIQKNLKTALLNYSESRNTFDQTQADNGNRTPNLALNDDMKRILQNNQYDLEKAVNSVELSDLARQLSVLTSPIAGILTRADAVSVGTTATTTTVFTIVDPTSLVFNMDVDEADIGKVKEGQMVTINLNAFPDENLNYVVNRIDFVSHATTNGGNAFTVEVKLPEDLQNKYRVGINGNANITTAEKVNALTIPLSSIFDNNKVYVKTGKNIRSKQLSWACKMIRTQKL